MVGEYSNADRACAALEALNAYTRVTRHDPREQGPWTVSGLSRAYEHGAEYVCDLLCDLLHLADQTGLTALDAAGRAVGNYHDEIVDETNIERE